MTDRRRVTQLRAVFVLGHSVRVVWWVTVPVDIESLSDDATPEILDVLVEHQLQASGLTRWHVTDGGLWLVAEVDVEPYVEPRRDQTRRATTSH